MSVPFRTSPRAIAAAFAFEDLADVRDRVALRLRIGRADQHRDVSFGELHVLATEFAGSLEALGATPRSRVALLLPHSLRLIAGFFGALYGGLVPSIVAWPTVKMDAEKYQRNLRAVLGRLGATWLVTEGDLAASLGDALGDTRIIDIAQLTGAAAPAAIPLTDYSDVAFIQFSGGTTGTQKSVGVSADHLAKQLDVYGQALALSDDDRFTSWLPLYHDMGLISCLLLPFVARLPVSTFSPIEWVMDPRPFLRSFATDRPTLCWLPNFAFPFLAKRAAVAQGSLDLSSFRFIVNCSEPVRAESMDAFAARFASDGLRAAALHVSYAMAEATFAVTQTTEAEPPRRLDASIQSLSMGRIEPAPAPVRTLVSCGRALETVEIRIVGDDGRALDERAIGEIWLKGAFLMDRYLGADRDAFTDGWYRTGDLGALVDGHLYVTGRKKDLIIVGGVNVYPEDVESAVSEVSDVHAGRVVALGLTNDAAGTEQLVVIAEAKDAAALANIAGIEAAVRSTVLTVTGIAPAHVFIVPPKWIVKSTAGKIARGETRARVHAQWDELVARGGSRGEKVN